MSSHSKLSASGSQRWILCPGSVKAEEDFPATTSKYAEEGILAHEIAASILNNIEAPIPLDAEMSNAVGEYITYITDLNLDKYYIEKKVDFSHIVPEGFGTADLIGIYYLEEIHIVDFKYGKGVKVYAKDNTQLLLYAIGALNTLSSDLTEDHDYQITMHIIQPRMNHFDSWTISMRELWRWEGYLKAKAEAALDPEAKRIPSDEACKWCKANSTCAAIYNFIDENVLTTVNTYLTDEQAKIILDKSKLIVKFINLVEENVYNRLASGNNFIGYKLVRGRNIRKINLENEKLLFELLGEKAYSKSLIGIKELEKLVDKETLTSLIYTAVSNPILVKDNDKRESLNLDDFKFDPVEA